MMMLQKKTNEKNKLPGNRFRLSSRGFYHVKKELLFYCHGFC